MRNQQEHMGKQGGSNQGSQMRTASDSSSRKASESERSMRGSDTDDQPRDAQGRFTDDDQPRDAQGRFTDEDAGNRSRSASAGGDNDDQPRDEQGRFTDDESNRNQSRSRH